MNVDYLHCLFKPVDVNARQKAYRDFLAGGFWKGLSARKRLLVGKCERCGLVERLQCHHKEYPKDWNDTTLEQLEVLCRGCHRKEHGLSGSWEPANFDRKMKALWVRLRYCTKDFQDVAGMEEQRELVSLVNYVDQKDELQAYFRTAAAMQTCKPSKQRWRRFRRQWMEGRLWLWAEKKFYRIEREVCDVG